MSVGAGSTEARRSAKANLGLVIALGVIALALWGFSALADAYGEGGTLARLDTSVLEWLQQNGSERGESLWVAVSWLGSPVLFAVDLGVTAWLAMHRERRLLTFWLSTILGALVLDEVLKLAFHRARPTVASEFIVGHSWSFPSGHALNSLVGYWALAFLSRRHNTSPRARAAITAGTVLLIAAIGFSRLYLGVHYLSDVSAGYLAGTAWVLACIVAERYVRHPSRAPRVPSQR